MKSFFQFWERELPDLILNPSFCYIAITFEPETFENETKAKRLRL